MLRHAWVVCWLACLGCHSLVAMRLDSEGEPIDPVPGTIWLDERMPEPPASGETARISSALSLAAACLEKGNQEEACTHLGRHLACHPEEFSLRAEYADLLFKLDRLPEAREHFERFLADAAADAVERRSLIHIHGQLMDIAEREDDAYAVRLHRGIGLYLLACCRAELSGAGDQLPAEGLLWKAAGELAEAHELRREDARPCCYLHAIWRKLGQQGHAVRWLRQAVAASPFSTLTPAEQRGLQLALREQENALIR